MSARHPLSIVMMCHARTMIAFMLVIGSAACPPPAKSNDPSLQTLIISDATLSPAFTPETMVYTAAVGLCLQTVTISATAADPKAQIRVNGTAVTSGMPSPLPRLTPGMNTVTVEVTASSGARRIYTIMVLAGGSTYVKASNTGADDFFGGVGRVAISGDTLAVGAPGESSSAIGIDGNQADNSKPGSGAVYIFIRSGNGWAQQAYIKASNPDAGDGFGVSVALSGDTLIVGAPGESSGSSGVGGDQTSNVASSSGAAYVFVRTGTTWTQQAYIKSPDPDTDDQFGTSVAVDGNTLAVGARWESSSATGINGDIFNNSLQQSGAAYVYVRSGTTWSLQAYVKASNTGAGDEFGDSIALSGDTLAVGAPVESSAATGIGGSQTDDTAPGSGAVYIFTRSGTTWSQQAYIKASNTGQYDHFGASIALSRDTLAVGAGDESSNARGIGGNGNDDSAPSSGAVYIFTRSGSVWSQQAYIKASNAEQGDSFGSSVALDGDRLLVGAPSEDSTATGEGGNQADNGARNSGAAYLFTRSATTWSQRGYLKASNTGANDGFGASVALSGTTLAIGSPQEASSATGIGGNQADNSAANSGAVYVCP
ncbi:MAG TPA: cadherin-like beta sandwich domain-containing protein [Polyangia bacterium]|nr:cadherin-like beta sandwich domain-containing protein [Polyangia bacterium]